MLLHSSSFHTLQKYLALYCLKMTPASGKGGIFLVCPGFTRT